MNNHEQTLEMQIYDYGEGLMNGSYRPTRIETDRGNIHCHYYPVEGATCAVILVGGAGGGFDSPAHNLYPHLAEELQLSGIASLRVQYRHANDLEECTLDVLAGINYLETEIGVTCIGLVGHSFGGAAVVQAAAVSPNVRTVVPLATQGYGIMAASLLRRDVSMLLMHGRDDEVLPTSCSEYAYRLAHLRDKKLVLLDNTRHSLNESADEVFTTVYDWLTERLR